MLLLLSATVLAERISMSSFSAVVVGVADLEEALALWEGDFGFEVVAQQDGPDAALARQWQLSAKDIARQALVRTPGISVGMVHLIEWRDPEPPVRDGAQAYDLLPKNLDLYTDDLPRRMATLRERGRRFSNDDFSEVTAPNGVSFREIHMPSHDRVNVVLLQMLGQALPFSPAGVSGIGLLISIVPDAEAEKAFYREIFGLDLLSDNILKGPEIEKMIGLPPGSALNVSIWGSPDQDFGRMELIEYQGARGNNLYPRARPRALGILRV
ncbi:MAG: VOC family protein, partial [Gammaproteobacteria bacterium]